MKSRYEYQSLITLTPNDKAALKDHVENAIKYGSSTMKMQLNNEYEAVKVLDPNEFFSAPMVKASKEEAKAIWPKGDPLEPCRQELDQSVKDLAKDIHNDVEDWSFVAEAKEMLDERGD